MLVMRQYGMSGYWLVIVAVYEKRHLARHLTHYGASTTTLEQSNAASCRAFCSGEPGYTNLHCHRRAVKAKHTINNP